MTISSSPKPEEIAAPDYVTLADWWNAWPEYRPEMLDFWARGNFTRRLLSRRETGATACVVRVQYLDELEAALKRLALLGIEIDFAWSGPVSGERLVIAPQDIDYEDAGGWGYSACSGDRFGEERAGKEWCPSLGWGSLLPDTITDWLANEAQSFVRDGHVLVCPIENMGLRAKPSKASELHLQRSANSVSVVSTMKSIETLCKIDLPVLEGMSIQDTFSFCQDNRDSLILFQGALRKLLKNDPSDQSEIVTKHLISQIREGVAELQLSGATLRTRKTLTALGASISTFGVTFGLSYGLGVGPAALGSVAAAMATLALWDRNIESEGALRKNPYFILWKLQGGRVGKPEFRPRPALEALLSSRGKPKVLPPYHWLSPPSGGWNIPTVFRGPAGRAGPNNGS